VVLIDVAIMEPKYQVNLGYIARVLKNFGIERVYLINPRCNYKGKDAIKYSKHAHALLEHAKLAKSIAEATKGAFVLGTTGIWSKTDRSFHNAYLLQNAGRMLKNASLNKRIVLLIGRDDTGLSKRELRECDATIFIGAGKNYPVLNISHALAIILYELTRARYGREYGFMEALYADASHQKMALTLFKRLIKNNKSIRDKESVAMAFKHVLSRAVPTKKEINAIAIALSGKR
jgi:TrmH family RNA methyltransferase